MINTPRYRIDVNERTGLIKIAILGFWDVSDVDDFVRDHKKAYIQLAAVGHAGLTLIDYTQSAIQSQAVVGAFQALGANSKVLTAGIALYSTGQFARLQAGRIAGVREDTRTFTDLREAMAWLDSRKDRRAEAA